MKCQGQGTRKYDNKNDIKEIAMNRIGIDVSCKELRVVMSVNGKHRKAQLFENTPEDHNRLINMIHKLPGESIVCMEATGVHHFDLAVTLSRAELIKVMVINPKSAHNFSKALLQRSKTDNIDADVLASYAERMPFVEWHRPSEEALTLRALARRIAATNKIKAQVKNQLSALLATQETPEVILMHTQSLIDTLDAQIDSYRSSAIKILNKNQALQELYTLITSIKGIAEASAIQLLGELLTMPDDLTVKQWVAYAGLDPRHFESGSSVAKRAKISKAGNRYIRQALYMPALVASRYEPHVAAYYKHLQEKRGLQKIQAICAVMRKILHAIYGMLHNKQPFDGSKFFDMEKA